MEGVRFESYLKELIWPVKGKLGSYISGRREVERSVGVYSARMGCESVEHFGFELDFE